MIGYELEFFVLNPKTLEPIRGFQFDAFQRSLQADGWKNVYDPIADAIAYSKKGDVVLKTDDPLHIFELNMPPRDSIPEAHTDVQKTISYVAQKLAPFGLVPLGMGAYPAPLRWYEMTRLNYILAVPVKMKELGCVWDYFSGMHIWLDVEPARLMETTNLVYPLAGMFTALFGHSSVFQGQSQAQVEYRIPFLEQLKKYGYFFGIPERPYSSFCDYLEPLLNSKFYFITDPNGCSFYPEDESLTYLDYLQGGETGVVRADGKSYHVTPSLHDVEEITRRTFVEMRPKFRFKKDATLGEFLKALEQWNDVQLLAMLEKSFLEIRTPPCPPFAEVSCAPALALGLQINGQKTSEFVSRYSYDFWKELRERAIAHGLGFEMDEKHIAELAKEAVEIAEGGLKKRNRGEEIFLDPIYKRIKERKNPSQETREIFEQRGLDAVVQRFSYGN